MSLFWFFGLTSCRWGGCVSKLGATMSLGAQCDILPAVNQKHVPILVKSRVCFRLRLQCDCVPGCPVCLWVPSVSLGSAKCAAMCCTNTTVATISPARCPLPPGRPETEGGGRRSRLSHRAGSAHLNQGGYCDGCRILWR